MKPLAVAKVKRRSNRFSTSPCINASASFILSRSLAAPANKLDHFSFVKIPSRQKLEEISHHAQDGNVDWGSQYDTTKKALDDIAAGTDRIARMGPKPEAVPL